MKKEKKPKQKATPKKKGKKKKKKNTHTAKCNYIIKAIIIFFFKKKQHHQILIDNVVFLFHQIIILVQDHLLARFMLWEPKGQWKVDHNHLTTYWQPIRKKEQVDHKVNFYEFPFSYIKKKKKYSCFRVTLVPGAMSDKDSTRSKLHVLDPNKLKNHLSLPAKRTCTITCSNYNTSTSTHKDDENEEEEEEEPDIDSDEETESVRVAIEQTKPIPLGTKQLFYVGRKRKYYKLRDILLDAITPKDSPLKQASATNSLSTSQTI